MVRFNAIYAAILSVNVIVESEMDGNQPSCGTINVHVGKFRQLLSISIIQLDREAYGSSQ